jgi:hypothetical protein
VLNGLTLGIENGALWHDPNVCFHAEIITLRERDYGRESGGTSFARAKGILEAHFYQLGEL